MMVNIRSLMQDCCKYPLNLKDATWLTEMIECNEDDVWLIIPEHYFGSSFWKSIVDKVRIKYNIEAMLKLRNIFVNTNVDMMMIHLTKSKVVNVRMSLFKGKTFESSRNRLEKRDEFFIATEFTEEYQEYINTLEGWIENGIIPENGDKTEFNIIDEINIDNEHLYPKFYSDKAIEVRRLIDNEEIVLLESVADIIKPRKREGKGKCVSFKDLKYPFNINYVEESDISDVILQKGDIIIPIVNVGFNSSFLFPGSEVDVYAAPNMFVLRCNDILPEYLYLYMSSETAEVIFDSCSVGVGIKRLSFKTIKEFPIIKPSLEDQKYIDDFNFITSIGKRVYNQDQSVKLQEYLKILEEYRDKIKEPEKVEDILNIELAATIKMHNETQLRSFLVDDLKELNTCFSGGAYKATLILAGSILEAVLIDWLSEIDGVDYFENDYIVTDRNGRSKRADLIDYINEIKYIERPRWMEEATKAHEIRKKRNLVHARLCINSDEVNERVCREVIGYLEDVLRTRGVQ